MLRDAGMDVNHKQNNKDTPLTIAAWGGHAEIVRMLLDGGAASLDHQQANGETALGLAACKCHIDVVRMLLQAGADKDLANKRGEKPLNLVGNGGGTAQNKAAIQALLRGDTPTRSSGAEPRA